MFFNKMKKKSYIIVIWIFFCVLAGIGTGAQSKAVSSISNAENNVFRIMTMAKCEGKEFLVKCGTCFLIGDVSRDQDQYILTANQVLLVSEKTKKAIIQQNKLAKDSQLEIFYRVVVSDDIALEASIFNQAQSEDYAILQLGSSLADRKGIPLGDVEQVKEEAELVILGYDPAEYRLKTYTSTIDSRNSNTEKLVYINNSMRESDLGAPVLDKNGNLLGLHNAMDDNAGYAVAVNKLKQSFQTLNVKFQSADSKYEELKEKILDAKEMLKKEDIYSASSLQDLSRAIEEAEAVYKNVESTNVEYENQIAALETAMGNLSEKGFANKIIIIILGILIVGMAVLVIIVYLRGRKAKKEVHYMDDGLGGNVSDNKASTQGNTIENSSVPIQGSAVENGSMPMKGNAVENGPMPMKGSAVENGPMPIPGNAVENASIPIPGNTMQGSPVLTQRSNTEAGSVSPQNLDQIFSIPQPAGGNPVFSTPPNKPVAPAPISPNGGNINVYLVSKMTGEKIPITKAKFIIGSQAGAVDYAITGQNMISRRHAEITMQGGGFYIRDLDSTNHTYVNGNMVAKNTRKRIKNADRIMFANIEYTFLLN